MLVYLPTPSSFSTWWNLGSLLSMVLTFQLVTGVFLTFKYSTSFESVIHLKDSQWGSGLRWIHSNGASLFFLSIYLHLSRNLLFLGGKNKGVWFSGWGLFLLLVGSAFLGYTLPLGQMSFWAAIVITSLLSIFSPDLAIWVWGDYSVSLISISFFYSAHFLLPIVMMGVMMAHISFLHADKSVGVIRGDSWVPFSPLFVIKDMYNVGGFSLFLLVVMMAPYFFMEPLMFDEANTLSSPLHILPEWYFLWAYAILRGMPSKLSGVLALLGAIIILLSLPLSKGEGKSGSMILFVVSVINLFWLGGVPVELPYSILSIIFTGLYLIMFMLTLLCLSSSKIMALKLLSTMNSFQS